MTIDLIFHIAGIRRVSHNSQYIMRKYYYFWSTSRTGGIQKHSRCVSTRYIRGTKFTDFGRRLHRQNVLESHLVSGFALEDDSWYIHIQFLQNFY